MPYFLTPYKKDGVEMPILIKEDDIETLSVLGSNCLPIVRGVNASEMYNLQHIPYANACLLNKTLKMLVKSSISEQDYKDDLITKEEQLVFIEQDFLEKELLNIARIIKPNGGITYGKLSGSKKKDRVIALVYGLAYVEEIEKEEIQEKRKVREKSFWLEFASL